VPGFPTKITCGEVAVSHHELVRRFFEDLMSRGVLTTADDIAAATYIEHAVAPFGRDEPGAVSGPDHLRTVATWLRDQFPDMRMTIELFVEADSLAAALVRSEGTNLGPLNGVVPPTGRRFDARQSHWFRVEEGRLAEHWATRDDLPTMLQLGVIRPPGAPGPAQ
jgi:predicted ester cyclase